jgi:ATP-dependent protease HslVU (ClpYQ) peptidase subunit
MSAADIVRAALEIASSIDIYTNKNILVEELESAS